jgi:RNA polymerase sigma factor (sigma-70 family)
MEDREIVEGYITGNQRDYDTVVRWIHDVVGSYVWMEQITPDDVVSGVSEKLLLNLRSKAFHYDSSLKTYVQRLTRYTIIDLARSCKRAQRLITQDNVNLVPPATPLEVYESKEEALTFSKMFALLGEKCRELWNMMLLERMTYKEIGKKLGKTEAAIKSQIGRCKEEAMKIYARIA